MEPEEDELSHQILKDKAVKKPKQQSESPKSTMDKGDDIKSIMTNSLQVSGGSGSVKSLVKPIATEKLKEVTVYGSKSKVGANDQKVLDDMASGGRNVSSIEDAIKTYGEKVVNVSVRSSGANEALYNRRRLSEK